MLQRIVLFAIACCMALVSVAKTYTIDDVPNVHLQDSTRYVSNPDGILAPATVIRADSILNYIRRTSSAEAVAVVVDNIDPNDVDDFATELFMKWGLGKSDLDNGLLILIAKDLRRAVIRPGYGLEGVLPDITCGKILRNQMFPKFKKDDYDAGLIAALSSIKLILTDPDAIEEIRSSQADADFANGDDEDLAEFLKAWFCLALCIAVVMLVVIGLVYAKHKSNTAREQYMALIGLQPFYLALTFLGCGVPAPVTIFLLLFLKHLRNKPHTCPNCGAKMYKVDEENDNKYLTHTQDMEERVGSVDYDVWVCEKCGETDIEPYESNYTSYQRCENCQGLTSRLIRDRVLIQPTTRNEGLGVKEFSCAACGHVMALKYTLPVLASAPIITGGGGGGSFGGGGGFGGGGFGGGMTGGGGASGGW